MNAPPPTRQDRPRRWLTLTIAVVAVVLLVIVIMMLAGGGSDGHGPWRHG